MKKRAVIAVVLAAFLTASAYAQSAQFFGILQTGTAQDVQAALDKGADANARRGGVTPLMSAANINPNPEVVTVLLKAGGDMEARDLYGAGATSLMWAAAYNPNPEVTATLLKAGADAKAKDKMGNTAFDYAKYNEKLKGTDALRRLEEASK